MNRKTVISIALLLLPTFLLLPTITPLTHAFITGTVCIADSSSTSCPSSPPTFTGATGSQLTIAVNVQGSDNIQGFDIHVKTDPSVLSPVSFDLTGSVLSKYPGSFGVFSFGCINGTPVGGTSGCSAAVDGPGVARVVAAGEGCCGTIVPTTGRLFSITYNIVGSGSTSIGYPTGPAGTVGCDPSSVSGTTTCVQVVNNASAFIPEKAQTASFAASAPPPDFIVSASPNALTIPKETAAQTTITITSLNGFTGSVTLSATISPVVDRGEPTAALSPSTVTLTANGKATSTLTVSTFGATILGTYTATVTATGGGLVRQTTVTITVTMN